MIYEGHNNDKTSAIKKIQLAAQLNIDRKIKTKERGKKYIPSPRRQIYVGNISFDATLNDVYTAIHDILHCARDEVTMPSTDGRNRGYAFATIAWPLEYAANDIDINTICAALFRTCKGRPIYVKEVHHHGK